MSLIVCFGVWEIPVCLCQSLSDLFSSCLSALSCFKSVVFQIFKVEVSDQESSWDNVVLIHELDEWFNSGFLYKFLFINASLNCSRVAGNSNDKKVWEFMFLNYVDCTLFP